MSLFSLPQMSRPNQFPDITMWKSNRHFKTYYPQKHFFLISIPHPSPPYCNMWHLFSCTEQNIEMILYFLFFFLTSHNASTNPVNSKSYNILNIATFFQVQYFPPCLESHFLSLVVLQQLCSWFLWFHSCQPIIQYPKSK